MNKKYGFTLLELSLSPHLLRGPAQATTRPRHAAGLGFTLIELAIVLVIIALIVGGVLVGKDLISAAAIRAQVSQIEKYDAAVNTFKAKYGALPGDIPNPGASQFGFIARGIYPGEGDGNGTLEGNCCNGSAQAPSNNIPQAGVIEYSGETMAFWVDLSYAKLIDGNFNTATQTGGYVASPVTGGGIDLYLPQAKIGLGNYVYVWSGGCCTYSGYTWTAGNGQNYFGLSAVTAVGNGGSDAGIGSNLTIPVSTAFAIDSKVDDGLPLSGTITTIYAGCGPAGGLGYAVNSGYSCKGTATLSISALNPTTGTCFDNGNTANAQVVYSMGVNKGAGTNCALSFKFR